MIAELWPSGKIVTTSRRPEPDNEHERSFQPANKRARNAISSAIESGVIPHLLVVRVVTVVAVATVIRERVHDGRVEVTINRLLNSVSQREREYGESEQRVSSVCCIVRHCLPALYGSAHVGPSLIAERMPAHVRYWSNRMC